MSHLTLFTLSDWRKSRGAKWFFQSSENCQFLLFWCHLLFLRLCIFKNFFQLLFLVIVQVHQLATAPWPPDPVTGPWLRALTISTLAAQAAVALVVSAAELRYLRLRLNWKLAWMMLGGGSRSLERYGHLLYWLVGVAPDDNDVKAAEESWDGNWAESLAPCCRGLSHSLIELRSQDRTSVLVYCTVLHGTVHQYMHPKIGVLSRR